MHNDLENAFDFFNLMPNTHSKSATDAPFKEVSLTDQVEVSKYQSATLLYHDITLHATCKKYRMVMPIIVSNVSLQWCIKFVANKLTDMLILHKSANFEVENVLRLGI